VHHDLGEGGGAAGAQVIHRDGGVQVQRHGCGGGGGAGRAWWGRQADRGVAAGGMVGQGMGGGWGRRLRGVCRWARPPRLAPGRHCAVQPPVRPALSPGGPACQAAWLGPHQSLPCGTVWSCRRRCSC
jgi:hypothetical protein